MATAQHVSKYLLEVSLSRIFVPYKTGYDTEGNPIIKNDVVFSIELNEYANTYTVQGLEPNTPYFIRLTAYNRAGSTSQIIGPIWTHKPAYETQNTEVWYDVLKEVVCLDWRGSSVPDFTYITYSSVNAYGDVNTITVNNVTYWELPLAPGEYLIRLQPCTLTKCGDAKEQTIIVPIVHKCQASDPVIIKETTATIKSFTAGPFIEPIRLLELIEFPPQVKVYYDIKDWIGFVDKVEYVKSDVYKIPDIIVFIDSPIVELIEPKEVITLYPEDICSFFEEKVINLSVTAAKADITAIRDTAGGKLTTYIYLVETDRTRITESQWSPGYKEFRVVTRINFVDIGKRHETITIRHSEYDFPDDFVVAPPIRYADARDYTEIAQTEIPVLDITLLPGTVTVPEP